ncbi:YdaU family protein [Polynucleobacter paneuropaeus]|jgi:hypothetical protein|nr:YdaU family protein [Polynucleobacter paneuropaeus]MBT8611850.1 YdaU family protein [Polynucleobacter paneuropaeus]
MSCLPQPPAYQEYPADILNNESFIQMSMAERGLYWTLRMYGWKNSTLPSNYKALSKLVGLSLEEFESLYKEHVCLFFCPSIDIEGRMVCPALEGYKEKLLADREKRSAAGKKGAIATWGNKSDDGNAINLP